MDRRQHKTRKAILCAFRALLEKKRYDKITVQEIIDAADVGRSTFYAHFETKDLLLDAMCAEIFHHIFEDDPCPWVGKDADLMGKLAHTLWHIRDEKNDFSGVMLSESGDIFMDYFKKHLKEMFDGYISLFNTEAPKEFLLNHLAACFAETVRWWLKEGTKTAPETTAKYFISLIPIKEPTPQEA